MRTLAIDLGTRRVGLAMSDAGGKLATPHDVLEITAPQQATARILEIMAREGVERIVLGLPLNMDDTIGRQALQTIAWGQDLSRQSRVPLVFVDERLSSFAAEQQLIDRKRGGEKITRKQKKQRLDALAAASFLQSFLDGKRAAITVPSPRTRGEG